MTNRLLFSALLLLVMSARAQEAKTPSRFRLGVNASPYMVYRTLAPTEHNDFIDGYVDAKNDVEQPRSGYTTTLFIAYTINKHFGLEAGLGYALRGWQIDLSKLTFGDAIEPRRGFIYTTNEGELRAIRRDFRYLNLPLRATFSIGKGRTRCITSLGIEVNYLLKATSTLVFDERSRTEVPGYNTFNLSPTISAGVSRSLGERYELRLEPTFRYAFLSMEDSPVNTHLWSLGLNVGFLRAF